MRVLLLVLLALAPIAGASSPPSEPPMCGEEDPVLASTGDVHVGEDGRVYLEDNGRAGLQSVGCYVVDGGGTYQSTWVPADTRVA